MLVFAVMPFWAVLRHKRWFKCVLSGLNAVATGLIGAACVSLYMMTILTRADAMVFAFALTLASAFNVSAPIVVIAGLVFGAIISKYALSLGQVPYCST
jgi:chromate transporter